MKIITSPDPLLRETCEPVDLENDNTIEKLVKEMAHLMYKTDGVGLAAPQVGVLKRVCVIDTTYPYENEKDLIVLINPEIVELSEEEETDNEGCLSVPGIWVPISRSKRVVVEADHLDGQRYRYEAFDFTARAFQHEIDHLDGKTLFERLDPITRVKAIERYNEAIELGAKPGKQPKDPNFNPFITEN